MSKLGKDLNEIEDLEREIRLLRKIVAKLNNDYLDADNFTHEEFICYINALSMVEWESDKSK